MIQVSSRITAGKLLIWVGSGLLFKGTLTVPRLLAYRLYCPYYPGRFALTPSRRSQWADFRGLRGPLT